MAKNSICSVDDCGKPHEARGLCKAHYQRFFKYGDPLAGRTPDGDPLKFYNEVVLQYEGDDCLIWPFATNDKGYGQMRRCGRMRHVHRLVCEEVNGVPPTPKHESAHLCGRGHIGCVTKNHLSWKTRTENQADRLVHGTHSRGESNGRAKLTGSQAREILELKGKKTQVTIGSHFGVSSKTVSAIHTGRLWQNLE